MSLDPQRPRSKRSRVEAEEDHAWISFYRRVRTDVALATEVLAQLESDPDCRRTHPALYLCCKETLRRHKARLARHKRVAQFVRLACHRLAIVPALALRQLLSQGRDLVVECLPENRREPAAATVRRPTPGSSLEPTRAAIDRIPESDGAIPTAQDADSWMAGPPRPEATRAAGAAHHFRPRHDIQRELASS